MKQAMASFLLGFIVSFGSLNVYKGSNTLPDIRNVIQNDGGKRAATEIGSEKSRLSMKNCGTSEAGGGLEDCGMTLSAPEQLCPSQASMATLMIDTEEFKKQNTDCTSVKWETSGQVKVSATADKNGTSTLTHSLRNQNGAIKPEIEVLVIPQQRGGNGTLTAKLVNQSGEPCNCGDQSSTQPVETTDMEIREVELTKFEPHGFPKCEKCGAGRDDFVIRTNPAGYAEEAQVLIPSQDAGTHTATATLCNTKQSRYTLKGTDSDWFNVFDGTNSPAGRPINESEKTRWMNTQNIGRRILVVDYNKGKVTYSGNWEWTKLGGAIKATDTKFTTSNSFSTAKSVTHGGTISYSFKGASASVSTNLGVTFESTTTNTFESGGRKCDCSDSCKFLYKNFQSTIDLNRGVKIWTIRKTTTTLDPNPGRPADSDFGPDDLRENSLSTLPTMGKETYTNTADKKCRK